MVTVVVEYCILWLLLLLTLVSCSLPMHTADQIGLAAETS